MSTSRFLKLGVGFYLYSVGTALLVQFLVLPHLLRELHDGNGLLVQTDSTVFHKIGAELAATNPTALSIWGKNPKKDHFPELVGILYKLTTPKPWVVIPVSALLHAGAALVLILLLMPFAHSSWAIRGALPFLLFPSALGWYAQIHRDGLFCFGFFLFIYGWLVLYQEKYFRGILAAWTGAFVAWLGRGYFVEIVLNLVPLALVALGGWLAVRAYKERRKPAASLLIAPWLLYFLLLPLGKSNLGSDVEPLTKRGTGTIDIEDRWRPSPWLPSVIDGRLKYVAYRRDSFRNLSQDAGSRIDTTTRLTSAAEVFGYIPRALQISFFSPFPKAWFERGLRPDSWITRPLVGIEMLVVYFSILLLIASLPRLWPRPDFWSLPIPNVSLLILCGMTINIVGNLYRIRYAFIMCLVGLGFSQLGYLWEKLRRFAPLKQVTSNP